VQPSGALVARQLVERVLTLSDESIWLIWAVLLVWSYLAGLVWRVYDFVFVGWPDDLRLIQEAICYGLVPKKAY
jgi:hypothetical protein